MIIIVTMCPDSDNNCDNVLLTVHSSQVSVLNDCDVNIITLTFIVEKVMLI